MGGDTYTTWSAETLEQLAGDIDAAHKTIVAELDDLETRVEQNLADWQGDARSEYTRCKQEWNKLQDEQNEILQKFQAAVRQIHQQYGDTEKKNTSIWG